jgi:hypothetical protein
MKAIAYEIIDGVKVVRAFGTPTIDPELTKIEARKRLVTSEQFRDFDRAYTVCAGLVDASPEELEAAKAQLPEQLREIVELQASLIKDHPVFFYVPGEANVTDNRADELRAKLDGLGPHELLALDGSIVADHRGRTAWKLEAARWARVDVDKLGDELPDGYQWSEDLTAEDVATITHQLDRDRIEALSADERRAHAEAEISAALDDLAKQHARAQICGDESALSRIRAIYGEVCGQIRAKYEVQHDGGQQERQSSGGDVGPTGDPG